MKTIPILQTDISFYVSKALWTLSNAPSFCLVLYLSAYKLHLEKRDYSFFILHLLQHRKESFTYNMSVTTTW